MLAVCGAVGSCQPPRPDAEAAPPAPAVDSSTTAGTSTVVQVAVIGTGTGGRLLVTLRGGARVRLGSPVRIVTPDGRFEAAPSTPGAAGLASGGAYDIGRDAYLALQRAGERATLELDDGTVYRSFGVVRVDVTE